MVAGPLPAAGVQLVAQNLDQFKAQMREATQAITQMGREGRQALQQMGSQGDVSLRQMRDLGSGTRISMRQVQDGITNALSVVGGLTAGVFTLSRAYDATIGGFVRYARQVRETAAATGQQAEEVSRLIQVMDDFEIDAGTLTMVMRALRSEGLTPSVETLAQLSDQFLALEPGAARVNFLMDRFGRSGAVFADLMEQGGDAIRARAAAVSDSLVLDEHALELAREQEIALDDLGDAAQGAGLALAQDLIPWVTEAARTFELLLTWNQRINAAFETQSGVVLETADNYHDYLVQILAAAVASGKLNQSQADLILRNAEVGTTINQNSPAWYAWIRTMDQATDAGIILDETQWQVAHSAAAEADAADDAGAATSGFADHMSRLDDETLGVRESLAGIGPTATTAFGEVDTSLANTIDRMRENAAWIQGGGLELQAAADQINQRLMSGAITPEQADAMLQPIEAAALSLQEDIGQISMDEATRTLAEDFGLSWGDARTQIQGARDDINNLPEQVRTQIAVDVQWNITGGGSPPGGQHGLNMTVPPGYPNDSYPILASSGERVIIAPAAATAPQTMIYNNQDYSSRSIGSVNMAAGDNPYEFDRRMQRWMGY